MDAKLLLNLVISPTLNWMQDAFNIPTTNEAKVMLLAIAAQESEIAARVQFGNGPARGFWQFERGGGVAGVLAHPTVGIVAQAACRTLLVGVDPAQAHTAIMLNDNLACVFARLLLRSDPRPMPTVQLEAWQVYLRCWRPGKPDARRWPGAWEQAVATVGVK